MNAAKHYRGRASLFRQAACDSLTCAARRAAVAGDSRPPRMLLWRLGIQLGTYFTQSVFNLFLVEIQSAIPIGGGAIAAVPLDAGEIERRDAVFGPLREQRAPE